MEHKTKKHLSRNELAMVYLRKRSKYYQQEGYRYAKKVTNAFVLERIFAAALDTCVMFLPIALWELILLLIVAGILPIGLLNITEWVTLVLLVISILSFNAFLSVKSGGQTLGRYFYDFKIVAKNHKETSNFKLILREVLGFSIPTILLFYFFNILGAAAFWGVNFIFTLIHPKHISWIDMFLGTRIVLLREKPKQVVQKQAVKTVAQPLTTIDLHVHSNFSSDGQFTVEEIFQQAVKKGLKTISICDHNSVKANMIAQRMAPLYHVQYIPGVEFDCRYQGRHLRILGYFINYSSDIYAHMENEALKREKNACMKRIQLLKEVTGIALDVQELVEKNRFQKVSGYTLCKMLFEHPQAKNNALIQRYLMKENPIKALEKDLFYKGKPCYVEVRYPKLEDIIDVIQLTGGVAVLSWAKDLLQEDAEFIKQLFTYDIVGIEVFTSGHQEAEMAKLMKIAKEQELFITAGSDFHGMSKAVSLGDTGCPKQAEHFVQSFIDAYTLS